MRMSASAAISDRDNRREKITVHMEPELAARVIAAADADGRPVSNWVRLAVLKKLEELTDG